MSELRLRNMRLADLPAVFALQCEVYPPIYHEALNALSSRLEACPESCFVFERGPHLLAYVLAHPWCGTPPALHQPLVLQAKADHVFLHDLVVAPASRGLKLGEQLLGAVLGQAERAGFARMSLVAVGSALSFWHALGFRVDVEPGLPAVYGKASKMCRALLRVEC